MVEVPGRNEAVSALVARSARDENSLVDPLLLHPVRIQREHRPERVQLGHALRYCQPGQLHQLHTRDRQPPSAEPRSAPANEPVRGSDLGRWALTWSSEKAPLGPIKYLSMALASSAVMYLSEGAEWVERENGFMRERAWVRGELGGGRALG